MRPSFGLAAIALCLMPSLAASQVAGEDRATEPGSAAAGLISIQLNKLEQVSNACQTYFVVDNETAHQLRELQIDVFVFDSGGMIIRRIALTFQNIRANRTKVIIFDLVSLACTDIGRILVNDIVACANEGGAMVPGCADLLSVGSRVDAKFDY